MVEHFAFEYLSTSAVFIPQPDSLGTLRFHVTADKFGDTPQCHVRLQTPEHSPLFLF